MVVNRPAVFVFHRIDFSIGMKLDYVALAHQSEPIRPHRQCTFAAYALKSLEARIAHSCMRRIATHGVDVLVKRLLQMNQRALARAIAPVLERRKA